MPDPWKKPGVGRSSSSLLFLGTKYLHRIHPSTLFWAIVVISCVLFGVGHIGQLKGHDVATWFILSLMGFSLAMYAYFSRSFWIALLNHSLYDFAVSIHAISTSSYAWWPYLVVFWIILVFLYYRWRRSRVITNFRNNAAEVSQ
ncbi:CPBP family intramembrane metalloprotease [Alicyclobacillus sp. SO9]|nr:CPBP family intramembrane metalloprotease [Alicyclobacillus sp. SO9]